jgi:hypothetical protein
MIKEDEVKGYLIYYTTNPQLKEWVEEVVSDDVLTHQVANLTPDTKYYFRMSARMNSKGFFSPTTEIKSVSTPPSKKMQDFSSNGKHNSRGKVELLRCEEQLIGSYDQNRVLIVSVILTRAIDTEIETNLN